MLCLQPISHKVSMHKYLVKVHYKYYNVFAKIWPSHIITSNVQRCQYERNAKSYGILKYISIISKHKGQWMNFIGMVQCMEEWWVTLTVKLSTKSSKLNSSMNQYN